MCGEVKLLVEFYAMSSQADGKHYYCKLCCAVRRSGERVGRRDKKSRISYRQVNRAGSLGLEAEQISIRKLYERDRGICQICKKVVPSNEASIDHIKPLSKGGTHTWGNVQLTHLKCNLKKGSHVGLRKGLSARIRKKRGTDS